jgi:eukaryotic-like serine/threonine-protein kinase
MKHALGPEHPDTLASHHRLATALCSLGRLTEAETEHRIAFDLRSKTLGADHPSTLASQASLAEIQQRLKTAESHLAKSRQFTLRSS